MDLRLKHVMERDGVRMKIRKATENDIDAVEKLYDAIHTAEEENKQDIGWVRGIYPVRTTAEAALKREDLFVLEENGTLYGTAIINKLQVDIYNQGNWKHRVSDEQVCVLHTLVISPGNLPKVKLAQQGLKVSKGYKVLKVTKVSKVLKEPMGKRSTRISLMQIMQRAVVLVRQTRIKLISVCT